MYYECIISSSYSQKVDDDKYIRDYLSLFFVHKYKKDTPVS